MEDLLLPIPSLRTGIALVAAAWVLAACDTLPEATIVPEYEFTFSFESGMAGWTVASADLGQGSASVSLDEGQASDGTRSARIELANPGGTGKVWMTRELEVTPDKRYSVEVVLELATADHGTVQPWRLAVGAFAAPPASAAALAFDGDTSSGLETAPGATWVEKSTTVLATADDEGRLHLVLGVWGATAGTRSYHIDDVRLVLTRI